jgi:alpha-ketoglutarate-dependent taurine dioxygenase
VLTTDGTLPWVATAGAAGEPMADYAARHRERLRAKLIEHGAVLLRGFGVGGVEGFQAAVRALSGEPLGYNERSSPRTAIKGNVYTSTDYPPEEEIFLHNENSYQASWPRLLFFHCQQAPLTQGATPLADIRAVHDAIEESVREEFRRRRWTAVRNFHPGFGVPWQQAFGSQDREAVRAYCAERGIGTEFDGDTLRTRAVRDAVHRHPDTGRPVWFNHITFFHHTSLPAEVLEGLLELFGPDDLPTDTRYGDGAPIPADVVAHLRACYRAASVRFDWRFDDVLVVENMTAAHAREPFTGARTIAVAMAEPYPA